ncbi:hypothetical protein PTSG_08816 [Salpingoeca rosetta]|uniref:Uncharacterized protein n=1 Tax=Salpingoeca rosetta (strain ATCC 50818 / BSB-021) TaxID=946362 RepID=F2UKS6_SALR5|nr:uncharacterized protein PTSG_08816 [Salpingoeca rosetta]EGD77725.1 hypothetical protein PTSG_08816 [Salpingoeca rosetta]|eukprot:XP_004990201.1 hypothetical protein PTSG_08816 [Salpingoeca rosetta]
MYRRHDQLEQQLAVNARRVYGEQLRADAERRRQVQEEAMQEKEKDTRMVKKILKEYQEDVANEKQFRKQTHAVRRSPASHLRAS